MPTYGVQTNPPSGYFVPPVWSGWVQGTQVTQVITTNTTGWYDPWASNQLVPQQTTGSFYITPDYVWGTWSNGNYAAPVTNAYAAPVVAPDPTPEQRRAALLAKTRARARAMRRRVEEREARRRAERLLLEHLDAKQREQWESRKSFHVETAGGRRRYLIRRGLAGNVTLVRCAEPPPVSVGANRHAIRKGSCFCAHVYHPDGPVPVEDNVLAQKMLLESEGGEAVFLAMANVS